MLPTTQAYLIHGIFCESRMNTYDYERALGCLGTKTTLRLFYCMAGIKGSRKVGTNDFPSYVLLSVCHFVLLKNFSGRASAHAADDITCISWSSVGRVLKEIENIVGWNHTNTKEKDFTIRPIYKLPFMTWSRWAFLVVTLYSDQFMTDFPSKIIFQGLVVQPWSQDVNNLKPAGYRLRKIN